MRIHAVNLLVALLVSVLIAWGVMNLSTNQLNSAIGIGSFVFFASTLTCAIGMDYVDRRSGVSVKLVGWIAFITALLINLFFALSGYSQTSYIISCGIAYLLFVLAGNSVLNAAQS